MIYMMRNSMLITPKRKLLTIILKIQFTLLLWFLKILIFQQHLRQFHQLKKWKNRFYLRTQLEEWFGTKETINSKMERYRSEFNHYLLTILQRINDIISCCNYWTKLFPKYWPVFSIRFTLLLRAVIHLITMEVLHPHFLYFDNLLRKFLLII